MKLFSFDSPLMTGIMKLGSLIVVTFLWLLFCVPVITAGASTAAFYYTIQKNLKYSRGYTVSSFWESFKNNFSQATKIWLILLAMILILILNIGAVRTLVAAGKGVGGLEILIRVVLVLIGLYAVWVFACVARFENTTGRTMKNALYLTAGNLPFDILILLAFAGAAFVIWLMPPLVLLMPGVAMWLSSELIERAFRRNMTAEQRREEDERNMDWKNDYEADTPEGGEDKKQKRARKKQLRKPR